MSKQSLETWASACVVLLLSAAPALAEPTQAQIAAIRSSCPSDYRAYCSDVPTGGSAALECLRKNLASLSAACQTAVNAAGGAPSAAPAKPPAATSTAAPAAPSAATPALPAATAAPAPAAPKAATPQAAPQGAYRQMSLREELRVIREACGPDYRALCAGERPGQGRIADCLRANAASLSGPCKAALIGARR